MDDKDKETPDIREQINSTVLLVDEAELVALGLEKVPAPAHVKPDAWAEMGPHTRAPLPGVIVKRQPAQGDSGHTLSW
jgi:hypothetical protein